MVLGGLGLQEALWGPLGLWRIYSGPLGGLGKPEFPGRPVGAPGVLESLLWPRVVLGGLGPREIL